MTTLLLPRSSRTADPFMSVPAALMLGWLLVTMGWWGLAFFPAEEAALSWLARAQAVCFGRTEDGLPETYGWIALVASPVSLIAGLVVVYGSELKEEWQLLRRRAWFYPLVLVLLPLLLGESAYISQRIVEGHRIATTPFAFDASAPLPDSYPLTNRAAEAFSLVDQKGERVSLESLRGSKVVLTFAFAHCHTMCPTIVHNTVEAVKGIEDKDLKTVIITLDPWRDTPSSLPSLSKSWKMPPGSHVLSGEVAEVTEVLKRYKMPFERNEKTGDVLHPALLYVLNETGMIRYTLNNPTVAAIRDAVSRTE